ncbi:hypothetical protein ACH5RR_033740 [Cinchona calisaya]|uniref:Uncharacterized protein n=1 Tax=Cinchona calisaya TaxID=153742 RepID=A0ABD2YCQ6_9GENT
MGRTAGEIAGGEKYKEERDPERVESGRREEKTTMVAKGSTCDHGAGPSHCVGPSMELKHHMELNYHMERDRVT